MPRIRENLIAMQERRRNQEPQNSAKPASPALARGLTGLAAAAVAGTIVLFNGPAAAAAPIACGGIYTAAKGDTLFKIADRAYGDGWQYKRVFAANRDLLPSAESLEVDAQILIPCLDGSGPETRRDAAALGMIATPAEVDPAGLPGAPDEAAGTQAGAPVEAEDDGGTLLQAAARFAVQVILPGQGIAGPAFEDRGPAPAGQPVHFVTGSGFQPGANGVLPHRGVVTDLVLRAFETAAPGQPYRVSFVNDRASHEDGLLQGGGAEIGFPSFKPDCGRNSSLAEAQRRLCGQFEFSKPVQAVQIGYFARYDDPLAAQTDPVALSGKRLCHPQGSFDFAEAGLAAPGAILEAGLTAQQCFERLAAGEVDAVVSVKSDNDTQTGLLGLESSVVEIRGMRSTHFLYAIAPKSSPEALEALDAVNRGLEEVMRSGKWFDIVAAHLDQQTARQAGS